MGKYNRTVSEAIKDLLENGYDSESRVEFWAHQIEAEARNQLGSIDEAERRLREALNSTFRRVVDSPNKNLPLSSKIALERVRPQLRTELDRRVLASTNLIKLNREESLIRNRRRFFGWATSIPAGGRVGTVAPDIRHALNQIPNTDRRLAQDQSAKLKANLGEIIANAGGALAGRWHSNWRTPGYKYRVNHKHRDGEVHLLRDSWALQAGLIKKRGIEFTDEIEAPAEWPFCQCTYIYIYKLEDLPEKFLTEKGRKWIAQSKLKVG